EHQVSRLGRLDGNLCRFQVADLTHHDHVRVLAQECAQDGGEGQADARVHRHLVDALQVDFHGVLCCRDVDAIGVEQIQAAVQGNGLATAGGPGHQNQTLATPQRRQIQLL